MKPTSDSLIAKALADAVQPAIQEVATRLFYLTTHRPGSRRHKPTALNVYETTFAQSIYEHLLMAPTIGHLDIRHEFKCGKERVDIWLRNVNGGQAHLIEVGFYDKVKVESDLAKLKKMKPTEARWMLALFRGTKALQHPKVTVAASLKRKNGLDSKAMSFNEKHSGRFEIFRPGKDGDLFGYALLKGK